MTQIVDDPLVARALSVQLAAEGAFPEAEGRCDVIGFRCSLGQSLKDQRWLGKSGQGR